MKRIPYIGVLSFLFLLSGCRIVRWGECVMYQGDCISSCIVAVQPYFKSLTIYDQLTTKAIFDALWLADPVRTAFSDLYLYRRGKGKHAQEAFIRRQLEENNYYLSFYVLASHTCALTDNDPAWTVTLLVDGSEYAPCEIKSIDLPQEYKFFFAKRYNRFKDAYLFRFAATNPAGNTIVTADTVCISLLFRSVVKEGMVTWHLSNGCLDQSVECGQCADKFCDMPPCP